MTISSLLLKNFFFPGFFLHFNNIKCLEIMYFRVKRRNYTCACLWTIYLYIYVYIYIIFQSCNSWLFCGIIILFSIQCHLQFFFHFVFALFSIFFNLPYIHLKFTPEFYIVQAKDENNPQKPVWKKNIQNKKKRKYFRVWFFLRKIISALVLRV